MSLLSNLTGFGAIALPSMGRDGRDLALAVVAARYRLPHPTDPPIERLFRPMSNRILRRPTSIVANLADRAFGLKVKSHSPSLRPTSRLWAMRARYTTSLLQACESM